MAAQIHFQTIDKRKHFNNNAGKWMNVVFLDLISSNALPFMCVHFYNKFKHTHKYNENNSMRFIKSKIKN